MQDSATDGVGLPGNGGGIQKGKWGNAKDKSYPFLNYTADTHPSKKMKPCHLQQHGWPRGHYAH